MEADLKSCVAISMLLFVAVAVGAGEGPVGEIAYVEGNPEIIRDGDVVHDTVDFGFPVENFDSIRTDPIS